jgi:hypothetical protein
VQPGYGRITDLATVDADAPPSCTKETMVSVANTAMEAQQAERFYSPYRRLCPWPCAKVTDQLTAAVG